MSEHDTSVPLPHFLANLKVRGFTIVQVGPASYKAFNAYDPFGLSDLRIDIATDNTYKVEGIQS